MFSSGSLIEPLVKTWLVSKEWRRMTDVRARTLCNENITDIWTIFPFTNIRVLRKNTIVSRKDPESSTGSILSVWLESYVGIPICELFEQYIFSSYPTNCTMDHLYPVVFKVRSIYYSSQNVTFRWNWNSLISPIFVLVVSDRNTVFQNLSFISISLTSNYDYVSGVSRD